MSDLLNRRYRHTGTPVVPMSDARLTACRRIARKIAEGEYALEAAGCPACGRDVARVVSDQDRHGLPMRVVLCETCGFVYTSPRLAERVLPEFYARDAYEMDRGAAPIEEVFQRGYSKGEGILQFLRNHGLEAGLRRTVVELGCGPGGTLAYFRDHGWQTLGCDLNGDSVRHGTSAHDLDLHHGDAEQLRQLSERRGVTVGLIVLEQVLEHAPDPKRQLAELRRLMDPETILFIGVPGLRNVDRHYDSDLLNYLEIDHFSHFELATLSCMLRDCGLTLAAGDERIKAACALTPDAATEATRGSATPEATLTFLRALERRRRFKALYRRAWPWRAF